MTRRFAPALALTLIASPLPAQLPYLTAPPGTLRIELGGHFAPTSSEFADGRRRDLGDPIGAAALTAAASPLVRDLELRLGAVLGRPATGGSLGALQATAMLQQGTGTIGLAAGLSRRLTAFVTLPIVSVRTEARLEHDPSGATLGLNPAILGDQGSAQFLQQFDAALNELASRIEAGDYAGDPALQDLASRTLTDGTALRDDLADLLVGATAAPVLPTVGSADGDALLTTVAAVRGRFGDQLGIGGFTASPMLPAQPLTAAGFAQLLDAPTGFDLAPFDQQPLVGLGDVELGLVALLAHSRSEARRTWFGAWATGRVTLPTGTAPDPRFLRDAGTGDGQLDVSLGGIVEAGRGGLGVRASADYRVQLEGQREARVGARDEFMLPAARTALLDWNPGDVLTVRVEPFVRLADRLAISGAATWIRRGEDRWALRDDDALPEGASATQMAAGTSATALRVGLGVSYAHSGATRTGDVHMPVEAGLAIERTVASGSGLVPAPLSTRLWFRVYKRLW